MNSTEPQEEKNGSARTGVYELGYLVAPTVAEELVVAQVQNIKSVIDAFGAAYISEDFPKLRPLAYTMAKVSGGKKEKFDKAYFGWIKFEVASDTIPKIKTELDKDDKIVRFILISTVRESTLASQRPIFKPADEEKSSKSDAKSAEGSEPTVTQEELDKSIENLIV